MLLVVASQVLDQMVLQPDLIEGFMIIALSALDRVDTNLFCTMLSEVATVSDLLRSFLKAMVKYFLTHFFRQG